VQIKIITHISFMEYQLHLTFVMSTFVMLVPHLYPQTLGNGCA
jgi:hypothetical protein